MKRLFMLAVLVASVIMMTVGVSATYYAPAFKARINAILDQSILKTHPYYLVFYTKSSDRLQVRYFSTANRTSAQMYPGTGYTNFSASSYSEQSGYLFYAYTGSSFTRITANHVIQDTGGNLTLAFFGSSISGLYDGLINTVSSPPYYNTIQTLLNQVAGMDKNKYTAASWNSLQTVVATTKTKLSGIIKDNELLTYQTNLQNAINALVQDPVVPYLNQLRQLVQKAKEIDTSPYTKETSQALQLRISEAEALLAVAKPTVAQAQQCISSLQAAMDGLALDPVLPALEELRQLLQSVAGMELEGFTRESVRNLQAQVSASEALLNQSEISLIEVQNQIAALQRAVDALKDTPEGTIPESSYTGMTTNILRVLALLIPVGLAVFGVLLFARLFPVALKKFVRR